MKTKKELDKENFAGYSGDSEFLQYDYDKFKDWCGGYLITSIGKGEWQRELNNIIRLTMAWGEYQRRKGPEKH